MSEHTARICENGHVLTVSLTDTPNAGNYCEKCGAKGIDYCQDCRTPIPGMTTFWAGTFRRPGFCHNCGKPYPWTGKTVEVAETPQAKWVSWTSPFYWFLVIKSLSSATFIRLRGHHWTRIEKLTVIGIAVTILVAIATLLTMWLTS